MGHMNSVLGLGFGTKKQQIKGLALGLTLFPITKQHNSVLLKARPLKCPTWPAERAHALLAAIAL